MERPEGVRPGSQAALRTANRRLFVELLQSVGELTQAEVSRATGLAPATVSNIARELTSAGVLVVSDGGTRRRTLRLARSAGPVVGLDYGHRHVTVAIPDMAHQILAERRAELGADVSAPESLDRGAALLEQALADIGCDRSSVAGIVTTHRGETLDKTDPWFAQRPPCPRCSGPTTGCVRSCTSAAP